MTSREAVPTRTNPQSAAGDPRIQAALADHRQAMASAAAAQKYRHQGTDYRDQARELQQTACRFELKAATAIDPERYPNLWMQINLSAAWLCQDLGDLPSAIALLRDCCRRAGGDPEYLHEINELADRLPPGSTTENL